MKKKILSVLIVCIGLFFAFIYYNKISDNMKSVNGKDNLMKEMVSTNK